MQYMGTRIFSHEYFVLLLFTSVHCQFLFCFVFCFFFYFCFVLFSCLFLLFSPEFGKKCHCHPSLVASVFLLFLVPVKDIWLFEDIVHLFYDAS